MSFQQNLILSIVGRHAAQFGAAAQKTFIQQGGSIGRADDCDWVLSASGVSRVHAMVRYLNGMYFIEDRSTNGILLNGTPLKRGEPAMLSDGDRLQVDNFEMEVRLQVIGAPPVMVTPGQEDNPDLTQLAFVPAMVAASADAPVEDPFEHLWRGAGNSAEKSAAASAQGVSMQGGSLEALVMEAPVALDPLHLLGGHSPAPAAAPRSDGSAWNHTPANQDHFRAPSKQPSATTLPEDWDLFETDAPSPAAVTTTAPARTHVDDTENERILALVTEGVMEVLRARAEIKNSFRLPVTVIQRSENNPLKFAATAEEALRKVRGSEGGAFLKGAAAFDDAFEDIRCHQMAMLAGMRAGYEAVIRSFDPSRVEQAVDRHGGRFGLGRRGRCWDRYQEQYQSLAADPDDSFRRLFGDEFARAYESQLASYRSRRRSETK